MHDYQRPPTLYRYGVREDLELALAQGQFVLRPAAGCLTLSFSQAWEPKLFELFNADACLIIHNTEEFGERIHRAVQRALPAWAGIDGAVEYGARAALGAAFTKTAAEAVEQEWQFAWRAMQGTKLSLNPLMVKIGSIEQYAELRARDTYLA
ncbi:hypothetical protein ACLB1G_24935 [Oxalobacteraceae bacterium A2-2]